MRSFHATKEAGEESLCATLGMSVAQVEVCYFFHIYYYYFLVCTWICAPGAFFDFEFFFLFLFSYFHFILHGRPCRIFIVKTVNTSSTSVSLVGSLALLTNLQALRYKAAIKHWMDGILVCWFYIIFLFDDLIRTLTAEVFVAPCDSVRFTKYCWDNLAIKASNNFFAFLLVCSKLWTHPLPPQTLVITWYFS